MVLNDEWWSLLKGTDAYSFSCLLCSYISLYWTRIVSLTGIRERDGKSEWDGVEVGGGNEESGFSMGTIMVSENPSENVTQFHCNFGVGITKDNVIYLEGICLCFNIWV